MSSEPTASANCTKKTIVVVCPGRGSYNRTELGYLQQYHANSPIVAAADRERQALGLATVSELDHAATFSRTQHLSAENAAALIFTAGLADFAAIDHHRYKVVAVTGNSMGWYTALGCAGVWQGPSQMQLVSGMAQLTAAAAGGQFIYPLVDDNWQLSEARIALVEAQLARFAGELFMSIVYGGYAVLAGGLAAVQGAMQALPPCDDRFPVVLPGHAAFHSPLMQPAADAAQVNWPANHFATATLPLIDGRGVIWPAHLSSAAALKAYTFGTQVCQTYNFTRAVQVAVKEFAPDHLVLLGPGVGLGGAVAQSLIQCQWRDWRTKADFLTAQQGPSPYVLSMGMPEQRQLLIASG